MKFNELLNRASAVIPAYRQIVFKTIIIAFCAGGSSGRISSVFRKFALLLTGDATLKKFYNFLNSGKLPWDALWGFLAGIMGDPTVAGRLLIGLDDTTYGKNRKVEFTELLSVSKAFGCQVKVVFVYYKGVTFPLVTTDLTLTAEQMIEFYSARWKIES